MSGRRHPIRALRRLPQRLRALEDLARSTSSTVHDLSAAIRSNDERVRSMVTETDGSLRAAGEVLSRIDVTSREIRDTAGLMVRRQPTAGRGIRVLFLVHHIEAWDSLDAVVRAMEASEEFDPVVLSIPRRFNGSEGLVDEDVIHRGLDARGVAHLRMTSVRPGECLRLVKLLDPDVIFRQSQWDADIAEELSAESLSFARLCLVPYETMNLLQNVPEPETRSNTAVDSAFHRAAWLVFCANEGMLEMARRDGILKGAQFRVVGHPKLRRLREAEPTWPISSPEGSRRHRIAWSAHHSISTGWSDFGLFPQMAEEMLEWATSDPSTEFVWMPHPALVPFTSASASPYSRAQLDDWLGRWSALENAAVFQDGDYAPMLAGSDLLVTDGISMLVEYQVIGKPLVFVEREGHRPFNALGDQVVEGVHAVHSVAEARAAAESLLGVEEDPLAERQRTNVASLFGTKDSASSILSVLREELFLDRADRHWRD